jgi:hypothetical protein
MAARKRFHLDSEQIGSELDSTRALMDVDSDDS